MACVSKDWSLGFEVMGLSGLAWGVAINYSAEGLPAFETNCKTRCTATGHQEKKIANLMPDN